MQGSFSFFGCSSKQEALSFLSGREEKLLLFSVEQQGAQIQS